MAVPAVLRPSHNLARTAAVTLASGAAATGYAVTKVANGDVTDPFIASAFGSVRIVFDLGSAKLVDGVFLPKWNAPAGLTGAKWEGHSSNSWGTPDFSVTVEPLPWISLGPTVSAIPDSFGLDLRPVASAAARTLRWWSLLVPSFAEALHVGELLFGPLTDLWGFSPDDNLQQDETQDTVKETAYGRRWGFRYPLLRRRVAGTVMVTGAEEDGFVRLYRECSIVEPFVWFEDTETTEALYALFEKPIPRSHLAPATDGVDSVHRLRVELIETGRGVQ